MHTGCGAQSVEQTAVRRAPHANRVRTQARQLGAGAGGGRRKPTLQVTPVTDGADPPPETRLCPIYTLSGPHWTGHKPPGGP
jgi:hypothetical protein